MEAAGGRLTVGNTEQWVGDYSAAGVNSFAWDVRNFGSTDLYLRLMFADPASAPPANLAFSTPLPFLFLRAPVGLRLLFLFWHRSSLRASGDVEQALINVTEMRHYHSFDLNFPQPARAFSSSRHGGNL